jgi:DNA invertase Pin-like site-specific DNA recombinase
MRLLTVGAISKMSLACRFEMTRQTAFVGAYRLILTVEARFALAERGEISLDHFIAVLGGLADVERDLIRTRTAEGRSRPQKRGQRVGWKPQVADAQHDEARRRRADGATLAELARSYGVGKSTISRLGS